MRLAVPLTLSLGLALLGQTAVPTDAPPVLVFDTGGHTGRVQGLVFTPDGQKLVSASDDKTIRVWDVDSGACDRVLRPPVGPDGEGMLYAAALSADGKTLAVAGYGYAGGYQPIFLFDYVTGEIRTAITGQSRGINGLAFSPDGTRLASVGFDKLVHVWDTTTGQRLAAMDGHTDSIYAVAFAPDGRHVATVADDRTGRIWDVVAGRQEAVLEGHTNFPRTVSWSPDGNRIATGSDDQTVMLWGPRGDRLATFASLKSQVYGVQFTPDARAIAVAHSSLRAHGAALLDAATGKATWRYDQAKNPCKAVACNPKRPMLALGSFSGEIFLLDRQDGKLLARLGAASRPVRAVGWSRDGRRLAWGTTPGSSALERSFDLSEHQLHENPAKDFLRGWTDPAGTRIEYASRTEVRVVPKGGAPVMLTLPLRGDSVRCYTLLPGERAVVGSSFGLGLFDCRTGKQVQRFVGHVGAVFGVAVTADGRYFATAGNDHTLRIWRPEVKTPLVSLLFAGNEWIAWHGNGYYASSAGGEHMMGWLLGRGKDRTGLYCASAQVRKKLYRPELIKALVRTGDLAAALAEAEKATGKAEPATKILDVLPPVVSIVKPAANPLETDDDEVSLSAEARAVNDFPITTVRVLLDGRPLPDKQAETIVTPPRKGTVRANWKVKVPQGQHELVVQADSTVSKGLSQPVVIARTARGFKSKPGTTEKGPMPSLYVLAVGVADYPGELRLNYPAIDAREFAKTLGEHGKPLFKDVQTKVLTDKDATRVTIIEGLKWLRREATQHDYSVVFFAGHGERDADSGSYYLLPHDVNPKSVAATGYSGNDLKSYLANVAGRILVVLDTCHAGAFGGVDKKRSLPDDVIRDLISGEVGVAVMASSMAGEVSRESKKFGHGYFTQAMIEGLQGKAADPKGFVYLAPLDAYVTQRVKELTQGEQHPVINRPLQSFPLTAPKLVRKD